MNQHQDGFKIARYLDKAKAHFPQNMAHDLQYYIIFVANEGLDIIEFRIVGFGYFTSLGQVGMLIRLVPAGLRYWRQHRHRRFVQSNCLGPFP